MCSKSTKSGVIGTLPSHENGLKPTPTKLTKFLMLHEKSLILSPNYPEAHVNFLSNIHSVGFYQQMNPVPLVYIYS